MPDSISKSTPCCNKYTFYNALPVPMSPILPTHAGMRVYDVSDPYCIKEIAYFIPPNPERLLFDIPIPGHMIATTEDCVVDDRGYIYMNTWHDGMYILRCLV